MVINKKQIVDLLNQNSKRLEKFGVNRIGIFGSFVRGEQDDKSDVDLLVEFNRDRKNFRNYIEVADFTENIFGRKVDLLTKESLSPYIAPYIIKEVEYVQIT